MVNPKSGIAHGNLDVTPPKVTLKNEVPGRRLETLCYPVSFFHCSAAGRREF